MKSNDREVQVQGGGDSILSSDKWLLSFISERREESSSDGMRIRRGKGVEPTFLPVMNCLTGSF